MGGYLIWVKSVSTDHDELGYLWMKLKYTMKYLKAHPDKSMEDAEREFLEWIDGFGMDSMIEMSNRVNRRPEDFLK